MNKKAKQPDLDILIPFSENKISFKQPLLLIKDMKITKL